VTNDDPPISTLIPPADPIVVQRPAAPRPVKPPVVFRPPEPPAPIATLSATVVNTETIGDVMVTTTKDFTWVIKTTDQTITTIKTTVTTIDTFAYSQETRTTTTATSTRTELRSTGGSA
jgi:hypothetical protein